MKWLCTKNYTSFLLESELCAFVLKDYLCIFPVTVIVWGLVLPLCNFVKL